MLAGELALAGIAVAVVERQSAPNGQSRGGGVNARTAEVLAMRGLVDAVAAHAVPRDGAAAHSPQDRLEEVLEERLRELGVAVRRRTELTGLGQDGGGVTAVVEGPDGEDTLHAEYLVACDGGHSVVRRLVGADFPGGPA
jgi:2-polyprenyl-6-methoxyphenol hydroxylase-like FAD-dependent oxidoreductase